MRLVNLYSGTENELGFAGDVAKLMAHVDSIRGAANSSQWELEEQIPKGISANAARTSGKPLSESGIQGMQQLVCKVGLSDIVDVVFDQFDDAGEFDV